MSVQIGINPLTWSNDDLPSLGADTSLASCLAEGKQAGFSGFELGGKFPREADVLGPLLQEHSLSLVSGWFSGELLKRSVEQEIEAITPHLELLRSLGAKVLVYCEVSHCIHGQRDAPLLQRPVMSDAQWSDFLSKLNVLSAHCKAEGVQIAYHHHMGTVVQSEADIDRLMAGTDDNTGLLLDSGHLTFAGGDPQAVLERHLDRVVHVHCKDIRREILQDALNRNRSFLDSVLAGVFTVPGDGCVDYLGLFRTLAEHNYSGWLVVEAEQDPAIAHPLTYATLGADNLKKLCAESGLTLS